MASRVLSLEQNIAKPDLFVDYKHDHLEEDICSEFYDIQGGENSIEIPGEQEEK